MTVPLRPRIFISSLMQGYGSVRAAAARGVERAGCQPVRAEDFPAAPTTPRTACLDGVASCDAIVLILGASYGAPTVVGISATEEEYREAVRLKKPVFIFLEDIEREPQQMAFVRSIEQYVGGHWRKTFRTSDDLAELVEQALRQAAPQVISGAEPLAAQRVAAAFQNRPDGMQGIVSLQAVWATLRDEEVIDPTLFRSEQFQRQVQQLAHNGDTPLLAYSQGKKIDLQVSRLRIRQGDAGQWRDGCDLVLLDMYADGTLSVAANVTGLQARDARTFDLGAMYRLDPEDVQRRLGQAFHFATAWWEQHDPYHRHEPLIYQVALYDIGARRWETGTGQPTMSVTVPQWQPPSPLLVFDRPRLLARAELQAPTGEVRRVLDMIGLRFQDSGKR